MMNANETKLNKLPGRATVDVSSNPKEIIIRSALAGVTENDIEITVAPDRVTIAGNRSQPAATAVSTYHHKEIHWGPFSRTIILPEKIDPRGVNATMKNGIFTIILPKAGKNT
ncbi:MAG: HSP20 family protein [Parcubacteria group bacterium Licking1014_17]|nr:MAG: HSP20 family protein [Parcubacteria group bacterium Licking1014_17]